MALDVTIKGVEKSYGRTRVLGPVDLSIPRGEMFFLLGPSGCGKTTLLRIISGFIAPDAGTVLLGTQDVTHVAPQRRPTSMVFQSYALWPHMSVAQNVAFGLRVKKVPRRERNRRVSAALASVRMEPYAKRRPIELSGGQQQRVALARALVVEPQVLLLDEPLSNLDAKLRLEMRAEIRRICKAAEVTVVYVTHDQKEALAMADRIAILEEGLLAQVDTPSSLYRRPVSSSVATFVGETNLISAKVVERRDGAVVLETPIGRIYSAQTDLSADARECLISIRPESIIPAPADEQANAFEAAIAERSFQGEVSQLTLVVKACKLKTMLVNQDFLDGANNGRAARFRVDPRDVVLLPAKRTGEQV